MIFIKYFIQFLLNKVFMLIALAKAKQHDFYGKNLEIGSGPIRRENWITMDKCLGCDIYWDLNKNLPFDDNQFEMIYSSHVLEHFSFIELKKILKELHRVLKPGGTMYVCVPDAKIYINIYNKKTENDKKFIEYEPAFISEEPMDALNYLFYMNGHHKHMFDQDSLIYHLSHAGFVDCSPREFDPNLDLLSRHHTSLYVKCRKADNSI